MRTSDGLIILAVAAAILACLTVAMLRAVCPPGESPHLHAARRAFVARILITSWLVLAGFAIVLFTDRTPFRYYGIGVFLTLIIVVRIWRWRILRRYSPPEDKTSA